LLSYFSGTTFCPVIPISTKSTQSRFHLNKNISGRAIHLTMIAAPFGPVCYLLLFSFQGSFSTVLIIPPQEQQHRGYCRDKLSILTKSKLSVNNFLVSLSV